MNYTPFLSDGALNNLFYALTAYLCLIQHIPSQSKFDSMKSVFIDDVSFRCS